MPPSTRTPADLPARVRRLLRFEADVAFRRRAGVVAEYLDPQPGERVLDAGCGLGFYLYLFGTLTGARLYGVEVSPDRLRDAASQRGASSAHLSLADVTRLPFRDASFHKAILSEVLEHVPDDAAALAEVHRVLRPGGVLAVTVPNRRYPFAWDPLNFVRERLGLGHFTREPWSGIWTDHVRLYEPEVLLDRIRAAGFQVTDTRLTTRHAAPFSHHLIYAAGTFLAARGLLDRSGRLGSARAALWKEDGRWTPLRALILAFTAIDRLNRPAERNGPSVNICVRAVKPGARR